jgi:hypothetical protein
MTELEPVATTEPAPDPWAARFEELRARFPKVRDTVLLCVHVLQHDEDIRLDDLKARARLHGLEVTGASLNAARRLLRPPAPPRPAPARPPAPPPRREPPRLPSQAVASPTPTSTASDWQAARAPLAAEFPKAREGILYAVHRLRQDPDLTLPDIRADAEAAGVKIGGRSLHSARALLNGRQAHHAPAASSLADQVHRLVAEVEREASKEADRLREAIEEAVRVLRVALAE